MYFKLALGNVKKSFRDYSIYFLTLMIGICVFYVFNSIESQQSMMMLSENQAKALQALMKIIDVVSVFVSVILGFLIVYANRFLIRRRKKELAIYQFLGMPKGKISQIIVIETCFVALVSLVVGILLGVLASHGFAVITASSFDVKLTEFQFIFSPSSAIKTVIYFSISFVCVMLFNNIEVGRQKLINLLYADRKNQRLRTQNLWLSVIIFVAAITCLVTAYALVTRNGLLNINMQFWTSIALGTIGTFLFFLSLSGFFLKVIQHKKSVYFKGLNMFVLRQINSKINTTYISMTFVCLMLFVAICTLSLGVGLSKAITVELNEIAPYDATYSTMFHRTNYDIETGETLSEEYIDKNLMDEFNKTDVKPSDYAKEMHEVKLYVTNHSWDETFNNFIKLSDYNTLLAMKGKKTISLSDHEYVLNGSNPSAMEEKLHNIKDNPLIIDGNELTLKDTSDNVLINSYSKYDSEILFVVADKLMAGKEVRTSLLVVDYIEASNKYNSLFQLAYEEVRKNINDEMETNKNDSIGYFLNPILKMDIIESKKITATTVAYLAVYLGILFLLISTVVLAITQLSESSDNAHRYNLLRKLGADDTMINRALFLQIAIYFGVPMLLAIIHSIVGISVASNVIFLIGEKNVLRDSMITAALIIIIYGGYFLATYFGSKRILNDRL